jgi:hypothetical protein
MHTAHASRDLGAPAADVYDYLSSNANLTAAFKPLTFEDGSPTGVGSVRKVSLRGRLPFYERIDEKVPNQRVVYRIIKGSPMKNHKGTIAISDREGGGSHVDYTISFDAAPVLGPVLQRVLTGGLERALEHVDNATRG